MHSIKKIKIMNILSYTNSEGTVNLIGISESLCRLKEIAFELEDIRVMQINNEADSWATEVTNTISFMLDIDCTKQIAYVDNEDDGSSCDDSAYYLIEAISVY